MAGIIFTFIRNHCIQRIITVVVSTPPPINMEVIFVRIAVKDKGMSIPLLVFCTIDNGSVLIQLSTQHFIPILNRIRTLMLMPSRKIVEIHKQLSKAWKSICNFFSIINLQGSTNVCHQSCHITCLFCRVFPIYEFHRHIVPVIFMIQVANSHVYSFGCCLVELSQPLSSGRIIIVLHQNGVCRRNTASESPCISVHRTLVVKRITLIPECRTQLL